MKLPSFTIFLFVAGLELVTRKDRNLIQSVHLTPRLQVVGFSSPTFSMKKLPIHVATWMLQFSNKSKNIYSKPNEYEAKRTPKIILGFVINSQGTPYSVVNGIQDLLYMQR